VFTVPNFYTEPPNGVFTQPRKTFTDPYPEALIRPMEERYAQGAKLQEELSNVRAGLSNVCVPDATGTLVERQEQPPGSMEFDKSIEAALPEVVRQRTIVALIQESPYYLDQLPDDERRCYTSLRPRMASRLAWFGYHPLLAGRTWTAEDYGDRVHLYPSGARKLAADVSVAVSALAQDLGYIGANQ
jgi:hypothetical protein